MKKFFIYLSFATVLSSFAQVGDLRVVLEEDLKVQIKINELKKEQKLMSDDLSLAMQNTQALIDAYAQKTRQIIAKNEEQNFQKKLILSEIASTQSNLDTLSENIEKIYAKFKDNLSQVPPRQRELYLKQIDILETTSYANPSEMCLERLKFLCQVGSDANSYRFLGDDCIVFGFNTEFFDYQGGDVSKLFKMLKSENGYEILNLEVEKGSK